MTKDTLRIGCASGFWGDTTVAASQLIQKGDVDYLVFDYLSEITMSLLTASKKKNPSLGFAPDFLEVMSPLWKSVHAQGIKVITNSGGVNPYECATNLRQILDKLNVSLKIGVVTGDDLMDQRAELLASNIQEISTGKKLPQSVNSMNAYIGSKGIVSALHHGADVVITGRCVDSALTLAPLMHEFEWSPSDYDLLSRGSLAGHLIECGAQCTGGIYTDWPLVPDWFNIGFPVVECEREQGDIVVTKPRGSGGLVSVGTVSEQLVYEIGDPRAYVLPDVTCDWTEVTVQALGKGNDGEDRVLVRGAKGREPPDTYKVSATYLDGIRVTAVCPIVGPHSREKAQKTADAIVKRCQAIYSTLGLGDFRQVYVHVLGSEDCYGVHSRAKECRECVLWLAVEHENKVALEIFSKELAPAGTGMAPGLTSIVGGRPKVSPVLKLYSFVHPKHDVKIEVKVDGELVDVCVDEPSPTNTSSQREDGVKQEDEKVGERGSHKYRLGELAYLRSGDKGNMANIGVISRSKELYPYLVKDLTAEKVAQYFRHMFDSEEDMGSVRRFKLPGVYGLNFTLPNSLGGGGVASLRPDPQGKGFAQMLADLEIHHLPEFSVIDPEH